MQADGGELVLCRGYEVPAVTSSETILAHVRRLSTVSHANLVPVVGAEIVDGRLLVYSEYDGGRSLADLLTPAGLPAPQAVAVGLAVLTGLQALQRAGFAHGALDDASVQIASYGQIRLTDYGLRPRLVSQDHVAWGDPRRDVSAAGLVLCSALGIDSARQPGTQPTALERSIPALAATALTIASGSAGRSAATALMMLSDGAGRLGARSRVYLSIAELGRLASSGSPAIDAAVDSILSQPTPAPPVDSSAEAVRPEELKAEALKTQELKAQELKAQELKAQELKAQELKAQELRAQELARQEAITSIAAAALLPRPPKQSLPAPATTLGQAGGGDVRPATGPSHAAAVPDFERKERRRPGGQLLLPGLVAAAGLLMLMLALGPLVTRSLHHSRTGVISAQAKPATRSVGPVPTTPATTSGADPAGPVATTPAPAAFSSTTPQATITSFYSAAVQHRFDAAAGLWTDRMRVNYPPPSNINDRFAGTTVLTVNQARLTSSAAGVATVYVDLFEVTYGVPYHWLGTWRLVQTNAGWLLDQPDFQPA